MLKQSVPRKKICKRIAITTGSAAFTEVLENLLTGWGFELCRQDDPAVLILAEEGSCEPVDGQEVIWLGRSPNSRSDQACLPISVESLWQVLEQRFHSPPRLHMRMAVDLPARLLLRGEWFDTRLNSLSDMGARFSTDVEMVKQEAVSIELNIEGSIRQYNGKIIFSMAVGAYDTGLFQSGAVFTGQEQAASDGLRAILICWYLEKVRDKMGRQTFAEGLADFDLDADVRHKLTYAD